MVDETCPIWRVQTIDYLQTRAVAYLRPDWARSSSRRPHTCLSPPLPTAAPEHFRSPYTPHTKPSNTGPARTNPEGLFELDALSVDGSTTN